MEARQFVNFSSNEFGSEMLTSLGQLRSGKYFCDVTITCEGRQVEAHKMVLARGSRLFNSILKLNPQPHPLIFLSDVKFSYLLNILDFMYQGEVSFDKIELADFLAVARDLDVNNIKEEAFNYSAEDKSKIQRLDSNPKQQLDVNADYQVKTDNIPNDFHSIVNNFKVDEFEDFKTITNEDFEDFKDEAKDNAIKTRSIESSPEQNLNVDFIIKIEMENKNSEKNGKTILFQDSVNKQNNSHVHEQNNSKKLRIRDITKLSTNKEQDQSTSFENDNSRNSFECKQCNKIYSTRSTLNEHVLSIH